jgi:hypothetical protein
VRFTIAPEARQEALDRLLELNHQRYAEEVAAGLHKGGAKRPKAGRPAAELGVDRGKPIQPDLDLGFELLIPQEYT